MVWFMEAMAVYHHEVLNFKKAAEFARKAELILKDLRHDDNIDALRLEILYLSIIVDEGSKDVLIETVESLDKMISRVMSMLGDFHFYIPVVMTLQAKTLFQLGKIEEAAKLID